MKLPATGRTALGAVAVAAVAGLVVAGLFVVGSPATARKHRADQLRSERLSELHFRLSSHVQSRGALPDSLDRLEVGEPESSSFDPRKDPVTGRTFDYRRMGARRYEVCAVFETSTRDEERPVHADFGRHDAGRACFTREVDERAFPFPPARD